MFGEAGRKTLDDFLNDENIKPILTKLAEIARKNESSFSDPLVTLAKELVGEDNIKRVQQLLSNLQQINQSSLGDILIRFTTAQKELEVIEEKDISQRTEEEKCKLEKKDGRLTEIQSELKKLLEEKVKSTQNENHLDALTGNILRSQSSPNLLMNASLSNNQGVLTTEGNAHDNSASMTSITSSSSQYYSTTDLSGVSGSTSTNTINARIETDPELLEDEAQKLVERLLRDLPNCDLGKELKEYLATGIKRLTDYETKHSKLAELREQLYGTLKQIQETAADLTEKINTTLQEVDNACNSVSQDVTKVKEDLAQTTEALRKDTESITQAVENAVSSFTGSPTLLERSIGYLGKLIRYLEDEQKPNKLVELGIQSLTPGENEFDKWFDGVLQENDFKKSDEGKTFKLHEKIQVIALIIEKQKGYLKRHHPDQSHEIETAFNACITKLSSATEETNSDTLVEAQSFLIDLKITHFDYLNNLVKQSNTTCIAAQQASQSTQAAAEKFTAGGSRFTYFLLLSTGYISAIVASILLYHKSESVLYKMSFNDPFTIIITSCFLVSTIALFLVATSDTKITDDQKNKSKIINNNEAIKICLGVLPLPFITLSTIFFAARFLPNFIPPCSFRAGNWPAETILVTIPVGILSALFLAAIGVFLFHIVKKSLSDDQGDQPPKVSPDGSTVEPVGGRAPNNSPLI